MDASFDLEVVQARNEQLEIENHKLRLLVFKLREVYGGCPENVMMGGYSWDNCPADAKNIYSCKECWRQSIDKFLKGGHIK